MLFREHTHHEKIKWCIYSQKDSLNLLDVCIWILENIEKVIPPSCCNISFVNCMVLWYSKHTEWCDLSVSVTRSLGGFSKLRGGNQQALPMDWCYLLLAMTVILQLFWTWYLLNITILQVMDGNRVGVFVLGGLWCLEMLKQVMLVTTCFKTTQSNGQNEWEIFLCRNALISINNLEIKSIQMNFC